MKILDYDPEWLSWSIILYIDYAIVIMMLVDKIVKKG